MRQLTRRQLLKAAAFALAGAAAGGCATVQSSTGQTSISPSATDPADFAALSRMTYGPHQSELEQVGRYGLAAWIEDQLAFERIDDLHMDLRLLRFDTLAMQAADIRDWSGRLFDAIDRDLPIAELRSATLLRQLFSKRQLYETLVEFWSDHFNIYIEKGACWCLKPVDDREVIRAHALGNFRELLLASARSPAMIEYLDNQANRDGAVNENYARELLELHTLGVSGGYSQQDVIEVARAFTGWHYHDDDRAFEHGRFAFQAAVHTVGAKTLLSNPYGGAGMRNGEAMLEALAAHPTTAARLARKLARRLIGDNAPIAVVERAASAYIGSRGDIRALLRPLLLDGVAALAQRGALPKKAKRPLNLITSTLRALDATSDGDAPLLDTLARMGQPAFGWPTPDGYPDEDARWLDGLLPGWQFALALAEDRIPGTRVNWDSLWHAAGAQPERYLDALAQRLLGAPLPVAAKSALSAALGDGLADPALIAAALLTAPQFRWR